LLVELVLFVLLGPVGALVAVLVGLLAELLSTAELLAEPADAAPTKRSAAAAAPAIRHNFPGSNAKEHLNAHSSILHG